MWDEVDRFHEDGVDTIHAHHHHRHHHDDPHAPRHYYPRNSLPSVHFSTTHEASRDRSHPRYDPHPTYTLQRARRERRRSQRTHGSRNEDNVEGQTSASRSGGDPNHSHDLAPIGYVLNQGWRDLKKGLQTLTTERGRRRSKRQQLESVELSSRENASAGRRQNRYLAPSQRKAQSARSKPKNKRAASRGSLLPLDTVAEEGTGSRSDRTGKTTGEEAAIDSTSPRRKSRPVWIDDDDDDDNDDDDGNGNEKPSSSPRHTGRRSKRRSNSNLGTQPPSYSSTDGIAPKPHRPADHTFTGTLKRRISHVKEKLIYQEKNHRPYFTWWLVLCEIVIIAVVVALYGHAPLNFQAEVKSTLPLLQPNGSYQSYQFKEYSNFWFGPTQGVLAVLGAKYSPCMMPDADIKERFIDPPRDAESSYGCCVNSNMCFSSVESDCPYTFIDGEMCGGPSCCKNPAAFPGCEQRDSFSAHEQQCTCAIQARPCCFGLAGQCALLTEESCLSDALQGIYHSDKIGCSEVNCLEKECGLSPFLTQSPDQWYRLFTAIFLHAGVIHCVFAALLQLLIIPDVERVAGWWRVGLIFFVSATGGFLVSGLFAPYQVTLGGTGGTVGIIGALFVELIQSWRFIPAAGTELLKLLFVLVFVLGAGLLPYIDNYSHLGGFVFGCFSAVALLPYVTLSTFTRLTRTSVSLIALGVVVALFVLAFTIFYTATIDCPNCGYLNCIDIIGGFCDDHGQQLTEPLFIDLNAS